nr:MAG TPA: restriction endonuclease [Caudoviricetes sp.]
MATSTVKQTCVKCGKTMSESFFFSKKNGERSTMCRDCLTMYIDNRKPSTFLWILEDFDFPYVEDVWVSLANRVYKQDPANFGPRSVIGRYFRTMKMVSWRDYSWADSDRLNAERQGKREHVTANRREAYLDEEKEQKLLEQLEKGEISQAQYQTLSARYSFDHNEMDKNPNVIASDPVANIAESTEEEDSPPAQTEDSTLLTPLGKNETELDIGVVEDKKPEFLETIEINENDIISELTQEDMKYLALKWGMAYKPAEWVKLEEIYKKYESEYELNVDRAETLKSICKTKFKMDQAIDIDDIRSYKDLSAVYDQLRKSGKFTESQNVEQQKREIDSIGELVQFVENKGGIIPRFENPEEEPQDKIDFLINDMKNYVNNLVRNELGLGSLIESYVEKLRKQEVKSAEDLIKEGIKLEEHDQVTQEEAEEFQEFQMSEIEDESRKLVEAFGSF